MNKKYQITDSGRKELEKELVELKSRREKLQKKLQKHEALATSAKMLNMMPLVKSRDYWKRVLLRLKIFYSMLQSLRVLTQPLLAWVVRLS